jgi:hypothetical protein
VQVGQLSLTLLDDDELRKPMRADVESMSSWPCSGTALSAYKGAVATTGAPPGPRVRSTNSSVSRPPFRGSRCVSIGWKAPLRRHGPARHLRGLTRGLSSRHRRQEPPAGKRSRASPLPMPPHPARAVGTGMGIGPGVQVARSYTGAIIDSHAHRAGPSPTASGPLFGGRDRENLAAPSRVRRHLVRGG